MPVKCWKQFISPYRRDQLNKTLCILTVQSCTTMEMEWGRTLLIVMRQYPTCFPGGSMVKNPACSARDTGSVPGLKRSPGEGNGNPYQYSCLKNPMDSGDWWDTVHGNAKESDMTDQLNNKFPTYIVKRKKKIRWVTLCSLKERRLFFAKEEMQEG